MTRAAVEHSENHMRLNVRPGLQESLLAAWFVMEEPQPVTDQ